MMPAAYPSGDAHRWLVSLASRLRWAAVMEHGAQEFSLPDFLTRQEARSELTSLARLRRLLDAAVAEALHVMDRYGAVTDEQLASILKLIQQWGVAFLALAVNWRQADMYLPDLLHAGYRIGTSRAAGACGRCGTMCVQTILTAVGTSAARRRYVRCRVCGPLGDATMGGCSIEIAAISDLQQGRPASLQASCRIPRWYARSGVLVAIVRDEATGRGVLARFDADVSGTSMIDLPLCVPGDTALDAHAAWVCLVSDLDVAFIRFRALVFPSGSPH
jgi:hypothetical protein